jgi:hypothetical protein
MSMNCRSCGKPLPPGRLRLLPGATLCAPCKLALEGDERPLLAHQLGEALAEGGEFSSEDATRSYGNPCWSGAELIRT